jgi:hypothetical protein
MARETAELALLLAALPSQGSCNDIEALSEIEYLALRILKEASAVRTEVARGAGETRGMWRAVQPVSR